MKKYLIIACFFSISCFLYAQENESLAEDSTYYLEMLFKQADKGDSEKAIYYGKKLKNYLEKKSLVNDSIYLLASFMISFQYASMGEYQKAIIELEPQLPTIKAIYGDENIVCTSYLIFLAKWYYSLKKYNEAVKLQTDAVKIMRNVFSSNRTKLADAINNLAVYHSYLGNYREAIKYGSEMIEIYKNEGNMENPQYASSLANLADYYSSLGNDSVAVSLGMLALDLQKKFQGPEELEYATTLNNIARYQISIGNHDEAYKMCMEALNIRKKLQGTNHPDYINLLNNLADYYVSINNYKEAIRIETKAMKLGKRTLGPKDSRYGIILNNLASINYYLGNYDEAFKFGKEAIKIQRDVLPSKHPDIAKSLNNLSTVNFYLGNYDEAYKLGKEAIKIQRDVLPSKHPDIALSLNNLALVYSAIGNYLEAKNLGAEAVDILQLFQDTKPHDYAKALNNLSLYHNYLGNYDEAYKLGKEAIKIQRDVLPSKHPDIAKSLNNLSTVNYYLGNYDEAFKLGKEALKIQRDVLPSKHPDIALSLNNLALFYSDIGNYDEAIRLGTEALEIAKKVLEEKHLDYSLFLHNLALSHAYYGNFKNAVDLETKAMNNLKNVFGMEHPNYALSLNNLAGYHLSLGQFNKAVTLGKEATEAIKNVFGENHPNYALSLCNLSGYNLVTGNLAEAYNYISQSVDALIYNIKSNLLGLSPQLRESFWMENHLSLFNSLFPSIAFLYRNSESISELYDKTALFAKGFLLNTSIEMRKLIMNIEDSTFIRKRLLLSTNKSIYYNLLGKPFNKRYVDMDSLNTVIQQLEMELAPKSYIYEGYGKNLQITWRDVQAVLGKNDIAIEFLEFPFWETDSTKYVALTLKKGYDCPHMVTLFEKKQLDVVPDSIYYCSDRLYNLVWKPLEEELQGVRDIYFSPSGELHRIGIEYLPKSNGEIICDIYALHRLTSTRQLALAQDDTNGKDFILFGGMDYYADLNAKTPNTDSNPKSKQDLTVTHRINVESLGLQGPFQNLVSTKEETDQISEILNTHGIKHNYFHDAQATEESFKNLDGTRPRVIHIATHGKYLTKAEAEQEKKKERGPTFATPQMEGLLGEGLSMDRFVEDRALTRSYLLFSGGNHILNHEQIPEGVEDGILTAQEISRMDLRGLDLLVLSACQTGMGDIFSGEGVFGLQRGFKKAGAKTIIMSLWGLPQSTGRTEKAKPLLSKTQLGGIRNARRNQLK